jgi:hypothetical protein
VLATVVLLPVLALVVKAIADSELQLTSTNLQVVAIERGGQLPHVQVQAGQDDSIILPMRVSVRFRNWSFRQGWVDRCEIFPGATEYVPHVSNIRVEKVPIRPFRTAVSACTFRLMLPVYGRTQPKTHYAGRPDENLLWGVALFDQEGKQIVQFYGDLTTITDTITRTITDTIYTSDTTLLRKYPPKNRNP